MDSIEQDFIPDVDKLEEQKNVEGLILALKNEDYLVRKDAAIALKRIGDERAVEALIEALKYENWEDDYTVLIAVREHAAEALGIIGDKKAVNPLIEALKDVDEDVRWKAAVALGNIGDPSAVEPMIDCLNDDNWNVRKNIAIALGKIGDDRAFNSLLKTMDDKDWHVRKYAAAAIGKIGNEMAIDPLVKALNDEDNDVRWKSIIALGEIGKPAVIPLLKAFKDEDWEVRGRAAEVLGKIGDERAVEPLIRALNNKRDKNHNKYVRGRIIEALGKIGDERAVEPLINALDDQYIYVRLKASNALERIKSKGKGSWIVHYDNGEFSFDYPHNWEIMETTDDKKIIKGGVANYLMHFSINRHEDVTDIKPEEFAEILKNVFMMQNSRILSEMGFKAMDMDAYILVGENPHDVSMTKIMIVAFKKRDLLFYLWFAGEPDNFELFEEDIDLILDSFQIQNSKN